MGSLWSLLPSSMVSSPSVTPIPLHPFYKDPGNYTEPTQIVKDNLPISRFLITPGKSLLPCKLISSHLWWLEYRHLFLKRRRALFCQPQLPQWAHAAIGCDADCGMGKGDNYRHILRPGWMDLGAFSLIESKEGGKNEKVRYWETWEGRTNLKLSGEERIISPWTENL